MKQSTQDEALYIFSIALAIVAVAALVYMVRTPSLTGSVVLQPDTTTTTAVVVVLTLAGIAVVLGAILIIHRLKKEMQAHKNAVGEQKTPQETNINLATYVLKAKGVGFSDEKILSRLSELGWDRKGIQKYLK